MWVHKDLLADSIAIQLDNTAKENKNQYVFSFLGYLVETDVFHRVRDRKYIGEIIPVPKRKQFKTYGKLGIP